MTDNWTTELKSLSKLKTAGRLRYWRRTIEIPENELHAICGEIQAEHDNAVHALNKAAGNWAKADAELREIVRCRDCVHMSRGEYCYREAEEFPVEPDCFCAWGERKVVEHD